MMKFKKNFKLIDKYVTFGLLIKIYILIKRWNYFFLYIKQFTFTKKFNNKNIVFYNYKYNYLSELSDKYSSDKGTLQKEFKKKSLWGWQQHSYTDYYSNLYDHCRDKINLILEVGIGTTNESIPMNMTENGKPGASLKMWRDYFVNAQIYGADIDKNILFKEERIKTFYVDQLNEQKVKDMWTEIGVKDFDLIIDDGLHTSEANIKFFFNSFSYLKRNGVYIIEDVHNFEVEKTYSALKDFDPEVVVLRKKNIKYDNNNLIIIRKK
jgi:hypothetical protein